MRSLYTGEKPSSTYWWFSRQVLKSVCTATRKVDLLCCEFSRTSSWLNANEDLISIQQLHWAHNEAVRYRRWFRASRIKVHWKVSQCLESKLSPPGAAKSPNATAFGHHDAQIDGYYPTSCLVCARSARTECVQLALPRITSNYKRELKICAVIPVMGLDWLSWGAAGSPYLYDYKHNRAVQTPCICFFVR